MRCPRIGVGRAGARPPDAPAAVHDGAVPRLVALLSVFFLLGSITGCGDDGSAQESLLPAAESRFGDAALTWAWRDQVHYGDQVLTVPGGEWVDELQRTPYGFFLALVPADPGSATDPRTVFFDGEKVTDVPGDPHDLRVSEDGRYAGWVVPGSDQRVVAVDLETGRAVLSRDDLVERTADPENEDPDPPTADVLGFSDGYLYFDDPADQLFRARVDGGEVEELGPAADHELGSDDHWASASFGDGVGVTADGRALPTTTAATAVTSGLLSPDRGHLISAIDTSHAPTRITEAETGVDVTPDYGGDAVRLAGWIGPDEVTAVVASDWTAPTSEVRTCDLTTGSCTTVASAGPLDEVALDRWTF